eukprot:841175_1
MPSRCTTCHKRNAQSVCSRCKCTYYCSVICQRKDWKTHKKTCKFLSQITTNKKERNEEKPPVSFTDQYLLKACDDIATKGLFDLDFHYGTNKPETLPSSVDENIDTSHQDTSQQTLVVIPIYIKIPNRGDSNVEYEIHDEVCRLNMELYHKLRVVDVLNWALHTLNRKMSALRPAEYRIMNSSQEMISKSFCDITSETERHKYLTQFNKNNVMFKGLHLYCATGSVDYDVYRHNIQTLMARGHDQYIAEWVLTTSGNDLNRALQKLSR